ncbi:hypothetical protein F4777DRAFT_542594 [Nemania sp. FL0916]|nr:hypothetical protein F4777DRAFT_542594 [Nemania sp. FL0916]
MPRLLGELYQATSRNSDDGPSERDDGQPYECPHPKIPLTQIIVDQACDMLLIVGEQRCIESCSMTKSGYIKPQGICFHVNSYMLGGASPAFGLTLQSPTAVNKDDASRVKWKVKMPSDDPEAMRIIVNILYDQYTVPPLSEPMELGLLYQLTALAQKYDLVHLFRPWSAQWVRDMERYWVDVTFKGQSAKNLESLLWVYWILGHAPLYSYMVLQIAFHSQIDVLGKLTDLAGQLCFTSEQDTIHVPPLAKDEIRKTRVKVLEEIRTAIIDAIEGHFLGSENTIPCMRIDNEDDLGWRKAVRASCLKLLEAENLWPVPVAYEMTPSPRSISHIFRANPNIPNFAHVFNNGTNVSCEAIGPFWDRVEAIMYNYDFVLPKATQILLNKHAVNSGLAGYHGVRDTPLKFDKAVWNVKDVLAFLIDIAEYPDAAFNGGTTTASSRSAHRSISGASSTSTTCTSLSDPFM